MSDIAKVKQAYAPALELEEHTRIRKLRELPLPGKNLFSVGDTVSASDVVLEAALPGDMSILRVAERMGFEVIDVISGMQVEVGDRVEKGDLLCRVKTFFGMFTSELQSPQSGMVEFFTASNSHLGIRHASTPLEIEAYIDGKVVEVNEGKSMVIEAEGTFVQGIFGVGGERQGTIHILDIPVDAPVTEETLTAQTQDLSEAILVGGINYSLGALHKAAELGVSAVICGSIDAETLFEYVGYEIGVSITGDEDVPFSLIITEGFGDLPISKRVVEVLSKHAGKPASVNGATQVRAGATRPEIIVPSSSTSETNISGAVKFLEVGALIRIIRVPYFGEFAEIVELPPEPMKIPSGAHVRVLKARLRSNGEDVFIPRANVELV